MIKMLITFAVFMGFSFSSGARPVKPDEFKSVKFQGTWIVFEEYLMPKIFYSVFNANDYDYVVTDVGLYKIKRNLLTLGMTRKAFLVYSFCGATGVSSYTCAKLNSIKFARGSSRVVDITFKDHVPVSIDLTTLKETL